MESLVRKSAPGAREKVLEAFASLEPELAARAPSWLRERRRLAIERFADRGFPTAKDPRWRHTDPSPLVGVPLVPPSGRNGVDPERLRSFDLAPGVRPDLVVVNGRALPAERRPAEGGARVGSLAEALAREPERIEAALLAEPGRSPGGFGDLNLAFFQDGAFVHLPRGTALERPIHLLFVSTGSPSASQPRNLLLVEEGASARIVEHHVGTGTAFANVATDLLAGEGAVVEHVLLEEEGEDSLHVSTVRLRPGRGATVVSHAITLGGRLVRNEIEALLAREGSDLSLFGLYLVDGDRHVDNQTLVDHVSPRCTSRELYKGILDGHSRGIFEGSIVVRPDAQKTSARQTNRNLLLSTEALATSRPELEIHADDVRCNHGATIGQIEDDPLFYLRSRGIEEPEARAILTYGFAKEVIDAIGIPALRGRLEAFVRRSVRREVPA